MSGEPGLAENRVPDAGVAPRDAGVVPAGPYRLSGELGGLPVLRSPAYQLHEQRLQLQQPSCAQVGSEVLCLSGSLSGTR